MTDSTIESTPATSVSVEITHARPLAHGITAVEYVLTIAVRYIEQPVSHHGEALVGPDGCFLVERGRLPVVVNGDTVADAVFNAEQTRRRSSERETSEAPLAYWITTGARSHGPPPPAVRQAKDAGIGVVAVTNPKRIRGLNGTIYVDDDLYQTDEIRRAVNAVLIWGGQVIPVPVSDGGEVTP